MTAALVCHRSDVALEEWSDPVRGRIGFRTVLVAPGTTNPDVTAGTCELEPEGWLGRHRHTPAEVYHVIAGRGTVSIDGVEHPVSAGTTVYIPGNSEHGIHNTGAVPLHVFYAFAVGSFDDIEYAFTGDGGLTPS